MGEASIADRLASGGGRRAALTLSVRLHPQINSWVKIDDDGGGQAPPPIKITEQSALNSRPALFINEPSAAARERSLIAAAAALLIARLIPAW
jgi:hypothetical protein